MTEIKFNILDDVNFTARCLWLMLCGLSCCWGFTNNTILLIFASKIGFPLAVVIAATLTNRQQIINLVWYTVLLISMGFLFFVGSPVIVDSDITKNFVPSTLDWLMAVGLGAALGYFWHHPLRINVIIMAAGLSSLLPALIMAGYALSIGSLGLAASSLQLFLQYVTGILLGVWTISAMNMDQQQKE